MTTIYRIASFVFTFLVLARPVEVCAQAGEAVVQGVTGEATYTLANGAPVRLKKGVSIPAGALVRTARQSAVDLHLGPEAGTIRLTQNSVLALEKLDKAQTMLTLAEGSFVGWQ